MGLFTYLCLLASLSPAAADSAPPVADTAPLRIPYTRYTVNDALDREVTFYLSRVPAKEKNGRKPIALFIQGSGCQSLFSQSGEHIFGGLQDLLLVAAQGRVRVLVVEKPGVKFLDAPPRPGSAEGSSEEFRTEHTLPRWAEANVAALRACWTLPGIDPDRTLVVGHSEGGIVAARIAALVPQVTHVASLSGGGPSQLFDLVELQRQPRPNDKPGDAEQRVQGVYDEWARIQADPDSITQSWLGHPYRRWSSFLKHGVTDELLRSQAKVYLAHGSLDAAVPVQAFDVVVAELRARGRNLTFERLEGADHGFHTAEMPPGSPEGLQSLFGRVLTWILADEGKGG
ncbi:MAG: dienelactone hydrolase family protein [Planctomycetales bacterium]